MSKFKFGENIVFLKNAEAPGVIIKQDLYL